MGYGDYAPTTRVIMWPMWLAMALTFAIGTAGLVVGSIALSLDNDVSPIPKDSKWTTTTTGMSSSELTISGDVENAFQVTYTLQTQNSLFECVRIVKTNRLFWCVLGSKDNPHLVDSVILSYDGTEIDWIQPSAPSTPIKWTKK